jgi:hypothetical protein
MGGSEVEGGEVLRSAEDVVRFLRRCRLDLSTEKHLQDGIEKAFLEGGVRFEREKRLSVKDIPDFVVFPGIVIECKMRNKGKKMAIYKQLCRYAECSEVTAIILASNVSMGLPPEINGKPVYAASLSAGWI